MISDARQRKKKTAIHHLEINKPNTLSLLGSAGLLQLKYMNPLYNSMRYHCTLYMCRYYIYRSHFAPSTIYIYILQNLLTEYDLLLAICIQSIYTTFSWSNFGRKCPIGMVKWSRIKGFYYFFFFALNS